MKVLVLIGVIVAIVYGVAHASSHSDSSSASGDTATAAVATSSDVSLVAAKSACVATGIADAYTGDGKVMFVFTLRNTGAAGSVSVTPVRHYSDGALNESAMDMMDVPVPGYTTKRYSSEQMTYKAHEHEVVSCGLRLDGGSEIPIPASHI